MKPTWNIAVDHSINASINNSIMSMGKKKKASPEFTLAAAKLKLERATNWLIHSNRFWATLILQTEHRWDDRQPVAYTNGALIGLNPEAIAELAVEEVMGTVTHEYSHILGGDIWTPWEKGYTIRVITPQGELLLWNIAADFWINNMITKEGFKLPAGACLDSKYEGWTKVQIYYDLLKNAEKVGGGGEGDGPGTSGKRKIFLPADGGLNGKDLLPPEEAAQNKAEIQAKTGILLKQAAAAAKLAGQHIPEWATEIIGELDNPTVPWRDLLLHRLQTIFSKDDWTYRRTNRRLWPYDAIAPTLRGNRAIGSVGLFLDTSGSMSSEELKKGVSEFQGILTLVKPSVVHLIQVDSIVRQYDQYEPGANLAAGDGFKVYGRGGTSFEPPFTYVAEKDIKLDLAVYFTDMEGQFPSVQPPYPVIWLRTTTHHDPPFGDVIEMTP